MGLFSLVTKAAKAADGLLDEALDASKKVEFDEAEWLKANPRPHAGTKIKDETPAQRAERKAWEYSKRKARLGSDHFNRLNRKSYERNKDSIAEARRVKKAERTPEEMEADRLKDRARSLLPDRREYNKNFHRQHYIDNPGYYADKARARRGDVKDQTPAHANMDAINETYRRARELSEATGQDYVVDHVVPLKGHQPNVATKKFNDETRTVSGLNVQDNLLIVPRNMNGSKGAWFDPGDDPMKINEVARRRLLEQAEAGLLGSIK